VEEQIVKGSAVTEDQAGQAIGQREDNLEIVDLGQHQLAGLREPIRAPSTSALRAVAIDARVVDVLSRVTLGTFVHVPLQYCGATEQDPRQHVDHLSGDAAARQEARRVFSQHVDHPQSWR